jgi:hypothetical protein
MTAMSLPPVFLQFSIVFGNHLCFVLVPVTLEVADQMIACFRTNRVSGT